MPTLKDFVKVTAKPKAVKVVASTMMDDHAENLEKLAEHHRVLMRHHLEERDKHHHAGKPVEAELHHGLHEHHSRNFIECRRACAAKRAGR